MGWSFKDPDKFRCSCGERIADCPLFRHVAEAYARAGLEFRPENFGTAFRVSANPALNYYLTEALPKVSSTRLENIRDKLVRLSPLLRRRLDRQLLANRVFVDAVLDYWGASCYLDNSHSPFRLHRLATDQSYDLCSLHLLRDPRGVCLSLMTNSGFSTQEAVKMWLKRQQDTFRIARTLPKSMRVHYEALCMSPDSTLREMHRFAGLEEQVFTGNFKDTEHHILGNRMRMSDGSIQLDERWKRDMSPEDRRTVEDELARFAAHNAESELAECIDYYLSEQYLYPAPVTCAGWKP
jgi:hypothetical protein